MALRHLRIAVCFLGLATPAMAMGQSQAGDSTGSAQDSSPAQADTAANRGSTPDSGSADATRLASDSAQPETGASGYRGAPDTARARGAVDSVQPAAAATSPPPDSILSTACSGSAGLNATAPNLLVISFTPESGPAERAAVTKSVKGKLLGQVASEPGAYYLWVPSKGQEYRLRAVADQLIRHPQVRQVGSRVCPPAPPADTTRPGPTTQRPPER
jgi:hypothetical protein